MLCSFLVCFLTISFFWHPRVFWKRRRYGGWWTCVVMFRHWVLEDPHVIVAVVDPLKWTICLLPYLHIVIFTLLLFAHQSITWTLRSCVSSFMWETNPWSHVKAKRNYHVFHAKLAILVFMRKKKKKKKQSISLSFSWWNKKKTIMDHLSFHSHGSNPSPFLIWDNKSYVASCGK